MKLLSLVALATVACACQNAQAIPILQLYVEGGTYDTGSDTWVATSTSGAFRVWAIGNVGGEGGKGKIEGVKLSAVYSNLLNPVISLTGSAVNSLAFPGIADPSVASTPVYNGTQDGTIPLLGDGITPLPSHGEYGPGREWQEFLLGDFTLKDSSLADFGGVFPTSFTPDVAQINVYDVLISGLGDGDVVHFDLYNHVQGRNKTKYVFAPFSHDGEGEFDEPIDPFSVPEPASMALFATGALGAMFVGRRRRHPDDATA